MPTGDRFTTRAVRYASGLAALALLGTLLTVSATSQHIPAEAPIADPLDFACNAGNAGNAGLRKMLSTGPVSATDVLNGIVVKYNGTTPQSLRLLVVRIRDGRRIVASGSSAPQTLRPGQLLAATRLGYPTTRGLLPNAEERLAQDQVRFIESHVDARSFLQAVEAGRGDAAIKALGVHGKDVLVIVTIPTEFDGKEAFTTHPVALLLD